MQKSGNWKEKQPQNLLEPIVDIPQYIFTFFSERHHLPWHQTGEHPFGRRRPYSPHGFRTKSRISTRWHCAKGNFFLRHYWIHGTWGEFACLLCLQFKLWGLFFCLLLTLSLFASVYPHLWCQLSTALMSFVYLLYFVLTWFITMLILSSNCLFCI